MSRRHPKFHIWRDAGQSVYTWLLLVVSSASVRGSRRVSRSKAEFIALNVSQNDVAVEGRNFGRELLFSGNGRAQGLQAL